MRSKAKLNEKTKFIGISVTNYNSIQYQHKTIVSIRSLNSSFRIETDLIITKIHVLQFNISTIFVLSFFFFSSIH